MLALIFLAATIHFLTPDDANHATCDLSAIEVTCLIEPPRVPVLDAIRVTMTPNGHLTLCHGLRCIVGATETAPTLAFGKSRSAGPFRCTATRRGIQCVVIATHHGFRLSAKGVTRI